MEPARSSRTRLPDPEGEGPDVEGAAAGDREAFARLVARHRTAVYRCARALLDQEADAWDVAQEAFFRAWRALPRFRRECAFRTWVVRIAAALARNALRDRRLLAPLPEEVSAPPGPGEEAEERRRRLADEVARLPARQREVVALRVFGGLPFAEVARALGTTAGAARVNLHHALRTLRRRLEPARARGEID